MASECLFCRIRDGQIPVSFVHEDADCVAFQDINPQAPTHLLVIPRKHVESLNQLAEEDERLFGHVARVAAKLARERGIADPGWRFVVNTNASAGQTVFHLHAHVLGGRPMEWPPG